MKKDDKSIRSILDDYRNSEAYKAQEKLMEERSLSILSGDDVVHLEYVGEISKNELLEIKELLNKSNLRLSSFNKSGIMYNSLDEYSLVSFFIINREILMPIMLGVGSNMIWESLKRVIIYG